MLVSRVLRAARKFSSIAQTGEENITFLQMVEEYFNRSANIAGLSDDRVCFLREPDYSLKFNISYITGIMIY